MIKKILGTAIVRFFNAGIAFLIVIINSQYLGAENLGTISLIILGITIILQLNNFIGGGALIYLIPRLDNFKLFLTSYLWAFFSTMIGTYILFVFQLIPIEYTYHIMFLSLLLSLLSINFNVLLGKENIKQYNIISFIQFFLIIISLSFFIFILRKHEVISYVYALYIAYFISYIISIISIRNYIKFSNINNLYQIFKQILKYGYIIQIANIVQLLNYRLSYYIIELFLGRKPLGIYTVGVQLSEGMWLISKSVSLVQYTRVSNAKDPEYSKMLTLNLLKFTFILTAFITTIVLLLPKEVFMFVFGNEFEQVGMLILSLSIGIVSLSTAMIFSAFFTGIGKPKINMIGSIIGLVFTLVLGLLLIPEYGLIGAGITASVAYFFTAFYQFIIFIIYSKIRLKEFMIRIQDFKFLIREIKVLIN